MRQIGILLLCCISLLSSGAQTVPNLYREVDQEKMNHWVDSVFDAMSYDERIGQLFMVIANPKSDNRNMQRLMRYVNEIKIGGILFHKGDPVTQAEVTNRLQKASRIPMLVSLDGEWGLSMRLSGTTRFPEKYDARRYRGQCLDRGIWKRGGTAVPGNGNSYKFRSGYGRE